jgi:hypothetical protein
MIFLLFLYIKRAGTAMEALQAVLAVAAAIVSIWGSAICCHAVCCCTTYPTNYGVRMKSPLSVYLTKALKIFVFPQV